MKDPLTLRRFARSLAGAALPLPCLPPFPSGVFCVSRSSTGQIQVLERTHAPREECPIVKLTREARGGWNAEPAPSQARVAVSEGAFVGGGSFHAAGGIGEVGNAKGNVTSSPNARKKLRFGILLMCDKGMWPER